MSNLLLSDTGLCGICCAVINSVELTKKIVTLYGLRWKMISKSAPIANGSVEKRDVFRRSVSFLLYRQICV